MSRLLDAGLRKLFKSSVFYVGLAFMVGFPAFVVSVRYIDMIHYPEYDIEPMDGFLNAGLLFIGFAAAVLISLFVGREYSDGVMRNKLVVGHSRASIYLSNLIVSTVGGFILQMAYVIAMYLFCRVFFGAFAISNKEIVKLQLLGLCLTAAYSAIFTLLAMLIHSKAAAAIVTMITAMVLFVYGIDIYQTIALERFFNNPEQNENTFIALDVSEEEPGEEQDEEYYVDEYIPEPLTGTKRVIYEFLYDFLPSCQAAQISECVLPDAWDRFVLYDCGIVALTSMAGLLLFRRKDLK